MSKPYILYTYRNNPRAWKAMIVAKYAGVSIEQPPFEIGQDNKKEEYTKKFPPGKVPALETPDGPLFESNAIARYIAQIGNVLLGKNFYEEAQIEQWINFTLSQLEHLLIAWVYPIFGYLPYDEVISENLRNELLKALSVLNNYLLRHTYLTGESITIADIIMAMTLLTAYTLAFDPPFREHFPNVTRWFLTIVRQPQVIEVIGEVKLCEKIDWPSKQ